MERTVHQVHIFVLFSLFHPSRSKRQLTQNRQLSKIGQFVVTAELLSLLSNGPCFASTNKFELLSTNSSNILWKMLNFGYFRNL